MASILCLDVLDFVFFLLFFTSILRGYDFPVAAGLRESVVCVRSIVCGNRCGTGHSVGG